MPHLAVEIKSPDDTYSMSMRDKAEYYVRHGCAMVWLIYPEKRIVEVHQPGKDIDLLVAGDLLSGGKFCRGLHYQWKRCLASSRVTQAWLAYLGT
jgi:hypothetical protein